MEKAVDSTNSVSGLSPHKMADVTLPSIRSFIPAPILVVCSKLTLSFSLACSNVGLIRNEKQLYPFRRGQLAVASLPELAFLMFLCVTHSDPLCKLCMWWGWGRGMH